MPSPNWFGTDWAVRPARQPLQLGALEVTPVTIGAGLGVLGLLYLVMSKGGGSPPKLVAGQITDQNKLDFIRRLWDAMDDVTPAGTQDELGPNQRAILIAQASYETGWGATHHADGRLAAPNVNNYWNVAAGTVEKPSTGWKGPVQLGPDKEFKSSGQVINITQRWEAYGSAKEAVQRLLSGSWINPRSWSMEYKNAYRALMMANPREYVLALGRGGFFTANANTYASEVMARTDQVTAAARQLGLAG